MNVERIDDNHVANREYVDSLFETQRKRRDSSSALSDQDNDFDKKQNNNFRSFLLNREPTLNEEVVTKQLLGNELDKITFLSFIETLRMSEPFSN